MSKNLPIYSIAKELNIESNRIILACKTLGIEAKGATKRLNTEELAKVKTFFETGKNVSQEIIDLNTRKDKSVNKTRGVKEKAKINYFSNRLIRKS